MRFPARLDPRCLLVAELSFLLVFGAASCDRAPDPRPLSLRVGIAPYESEDRLVESYTPLVAYLQSEMGLPMELVVAKDYTHLAKDFVAGRTDLVRFGAFTFTRAQEQTDTIPLVMREVDRNLTTFFLAPGSDSRRSLADFRGTHFTFGSRVSISGHLMARQFLEEQGIVPEEAFSKVDYTAGHDKVAHLVRDGLVDLGAVNSAVFQQMVKAGLLKPEDLRIVAETPPYPAFLWAVRGRLPDDLRRGLRDAFMALTPQNPRHRAAIDVLGGGHYLPVSLDDYADMIRVVRNAEARGLIPARDSTRR